MSSSHSSSARQSRSTLGDPSGYGHFANPACDPHNPLLLGESDAARWLRSQITRIAPYFRIALLRGETGSGKQLAARAIHALSPAADGPFVVAYASTFAESLALDEAESPASASPRSSLFESARGGTFYLKGVVELSNADQAALSRFLSTIEERRTSLGGANRRNFELPDSAPSESADLNIRILAASDSDLRTLSSVGQFREDLYARLSVVEILVPPLRQREEDIPLLAAKMLRRIARKSGEHPKLLAPDTLARLQHHPWPGNLRELRRVLSRAVERAEGNTIEPRHLVALTETASATSPAPPPAKIERLHEVIQHHVLSVLTRCAGNKLRAAELLGISRSTLYRMLDANSPTPATE